MINIFKRKNTSNIQTESKNKEINQTLSYNNFIDEINEKFSNYNLQTELLLDECFIFIYRYLKNIKDSLIIASILKQIEISLEDIISAYSLDESYVNAIISQKLPELRVALYKEIEELPNKKSLLGENFNIEHYTPLYQEMIERIEYFFETKRNTNQILKTIKNEHQQSKLINNPSFLFLLNYLSMKDSLIIASSLDIIDIEEDEISNLYPYDNQYTENLLKEKLNQIYHELSERIKKISSIELETSYFEYEKLSEQYQDLLERIEDTRKYINNSKKKR